VRLKLCDGAAVPPGLSAYAPGERTPCEWIGFVVLLYAATRKRIRQVHRQEIR
jgi:hypothetical protein